MGKKKRMKPGPKPVVAKIDGDWVDALKRVLHIKRPKEFTKIEECDETEAPKEKP